MPVALKTSYFCSTVDNKMWWICVVLLLYYVYIRLSRGFTRSAACLNGKTVIITGANSGLGYQTALNLASRGCNLIMADVADMELSKRNIIKYTNNSNIKTKFLDLSSLQSVRRFASDINKNEQRLDVLINNAGIGLSEYNRTNDDLHPVMQINYFGHFLLTHLLLDLLKKSAPSRIVFSSSCMAFLNNLTVDNLNFNDKDDTFFGKLASYCNSKLAVLIACDMFAEKLKHTSVTCNSMHPGFVSTSIFTNSYSVTKSRIINCLMSLYNMIYSKDPWEGSQTLVHLAVSKRLEHVTGKYFWDCKPFVKPRSAYNKEFCRKIWESTEKLVKLEAEERFPPLPEN